MGMHRSTFVKKQKILDYLKEVGPSISRDISDDVIIDRSTTDKVLSLLVQDGTVHISGYHRQFGASGQRAKMYKYGPGANKKLPTLPRITQTRQAVIRYQQRNRAKILLRKRVERGTLNMWSQLGLKPN